jgi:AcrR family transcriptional regulator
VLARHGYQAARVDDIVRVARVSHGTLYLYFSGKEDLVRALADECLEEMVGLATSLGPVDPGPEGFAELRAWLERFTVTYLRWGPMVRVFMEERNLSGALLRLGMKAFAEITGSLSTRLAQPARRLRLAPDLAAASLLAMVERYAYLTVSRGAPVDDVALDTLARLIHRGFFGAAV